MHDIAQRIHEADTLWKLGDDRLSSEDGAGAYRLYTQAHDLVTDCPSLHLQAHRRLRRVSARHGHRFEQLTDSALIALAPLGVFELIAWFKRSSSAADQACKRAA